MKQGFTNWLRFNAVGIIGVVVQLVILAVLKTGFGWSVQVATVIAVELTVLHNFVWHERWTWAYRELGIGGIPKRLLRFNISNGLISIVGNLVLMEALAVRLHLHYMLANILAIITCSLANYFVSDKLVFRGGELTSR
jgi:putative flippase GtrA